MNALTHYSYLQVLDLLSTLAFITYGVSEANPLVVFAMNATHSPFIGLALIKGLGIALGFYCWHGGRLALLSRANLGFSLLIAWNLLALIVAGQKA
jgi:hypothetical protein